MDWTEHFSGWCHPARSCPYHINRSSVLCASSDTSTPVELPTVAPSSVQSKPCDASVQDEKPHALSIPARHRQPLIDCPDPDTLSQSLPGKARLHCNMRIAGLAFPQGRLLQFRCSPLQASLQWLWAVVSMFNAPTTGTWGTCEERRYAACARRPRTNACTTRVPAGEEEHAAHRTPHVLACSGSICT